MVICRYIKLLAISTLLIIVHTQVWAQGIAVSGQIESKKSGEPMEFATIVELNTRLWTTSDAQGKFTLNHLPKGNVTLEIRTFGYSTYHLPLSLRKDTTGILVRMTEESLRLDSVVVTAQRAAGSETSSYTIDRTTLDHMQILNTADITALLPGGKTESNHSLIGDPRIALRSQGSTEMGNQSFGTAIEVDGVRMQQNGQMALNGSSTRTVAASNIASIEVIIGIPSVEYGDLSNGIVRVQTRKSKSPYILDFTTKPHTKQISLSKGWQLGERQNGTFGVLNASFEHARSVSNLTSPYTTYQRNVLTLSYHHSLSSHLRVHSLVTGNMGGYNSESDPDQYTDTWTKQRDYVLRGKVGIDWQPGRDWLNRLSLDVSGSISDQCNKEQTYVSAATTLPQIHATTEGYHVGTDYDEDPNAAILLGPTGYWYRQAVTDNKPYSLSIQAKGEWNHLFTLQDETSLTTYLKAGLGYDVTGNNGRGLYYTDLRNAPTWREARYDTLPAQHALSAYLEPRLALNMQQGLRISLTPGIREDMTIINASEYGATSALSPRVNARIETTEGSLLADRKMKLALYGGWGKSVKLPSMQVLYPSTSYSDQLAFAPGTTAEGKTYYAYYTHPSRALYNEHLRWQYSLQKEIGIEWKVGGNRFTLSGYDITSRHPYLSTYEYTPYTYRFTSQSDLSKSLIPSANRRYSIDPQSGIVTVSDRTGTQADETLQGTLRNSYLSNTRYVNGANSHRMGIEWIIDLARIALLNTDIRIDGNLTRYRGIETTLVASRPSATVTMANGLPYAYIGYYEGGSAASNGQLTRRLNTNVTLTTHIPVVRLILSVRMEATFLNYSRRLQNNGILLDATQAGGFTGPHSEDLTEHYAAVYPRYYSTWEEPDKLIPFEEAFLRAKEENTELYQELCKLVSHSNNNYYFNPNRISPYFCGNLSVTKEIGDHLSISFQATNFWNNTGKVHTTQTDSESTLYGSSYLPSFYYGLNVKVKY